MKIKDKRIEKRQKINGYNLSCGSSNGGPIVEMTMNGLAFLHTSVINSKKISLILVTIIGKNGFLSNLPMKKVSELTKWVKGIPIIRTGLKFDELTKSQQLCLKHILLKNRLRKQKRTLQTERYAMVVKYGV